MPARRSIRPAAACPMTTARDDAAPASWEAAYPDLKKIARARLHAAQHGAAQAQLHAWSTTQR